MQGLCNVKSPVNTFQYIQTHELLYVTLRCMSDRLSHWQYMWKQDDLCARVPKLKGPHLRALDDIQG